MNEAVFHAINNLAGKSHLLDVIGIFFADKFLYVFVLIVIGLWFNKRLRPYVYVALASAVVSRLLIVELIKRLVDRPRPFEVLTVHKLLVDEGSGRSFPSGHAVIFFSIAFAFWGTRYFWSFFTLAVIGSVARIFVGVHYPSDILMGAAIGAIVSLLFLRLFKSPKLG